MSQDAGLFQDFRPDESMKLILRVNGFATPLLATLPWSIPLGLNIPPGPSRLLFLVLVFAPLSAVLCFVAWWVPKYYSSIRYSVEAGWLKSEGGVFWRKRSRLPMDRLQLVSIAQGPLQRALGVATVGIYTAATGQQTSEMAFVNVKNAEPLRDRILALAAARRADREGLASSEDPTREEPVTLADLLVELKAIRKSLERG